MDVNKMIARIKGIVLKPANEWPVIAGEPETVASLYQNYIIYLAALTPIATFIGMVVFGIRIPFIGTIHIGFGTALAQLILGYALALGMTFIIALIIDALAPSFGGEKNQVQALKTAAYGYTVVWVVGVLNILPGMGFLCALLTLGAACYAIYVIYLGLPHTMKCPQDRAGGYAAVVVIIGIVVGMILGMIVGMASGMSSIGAAAVNGGLQSSTSFTPDKSALGALAAIGAKASDASKKMDAAQKSGDANAQAQAATQMLGAVLGGGDQVEALTPDALKPFIPATLGGMPRTSFSAERNAPIGVQVSVAKGSYSNPQGGASMELTVTDMGGAKGLMALAGFANVEEEKQSDNGYERTYHQNGQMVHERWDKNGSGEYTAVLADRFIVEVKGSGLPNIDALKAALGSVNLAGLEALKSQGVKR